MSAPSTRNRIGIGEVIAELRPDFPEVTISKIRFLEAEGLVEPERTPAGYRKFSRADLDRLRYVLAAQRQHYLPLRVIRQHLDAIDRGLEPSSVLSRPRVPPLAGSAGQPSAKSMRAPGPDLRLSREELAEAADISIELLDKIEGFGLVRARPGCEHYGGDALAVAKAVGELAAFGLEPRHLRTIKTAADRQIGLFEQLVAPLRQQRDPSARARAEEVVAELAAAALRLQASLMRAGLRAGS